MKSCYGVKRPTAQEARNEKCSTPYWCIPARLKPCLKKVISVNPSINCRIVVYECIGQDVFFDALIHKSIMNASRTYWRVFPRDERPSDFHSACIHTTCLSVLYNVELTIILYMLQNV